MEKESKYYNLGNTLQIIKNVKSIKKINSITSINNFKFNTMLYLVLHLSIIIIFEIFFYFLYIIKKEYELFDYLIDDITNNDYYHLNDTTKVIISNFLKNMTNLNYINYKAIQDKNNRINTKNELFHNSLIIVGILSSISISIISFGLLKNKIKLRCLILDLFTILFMISVFEYVFFTKIISNIKPISPYELLDSILNRILHNYIDII
jgi:hypothetical protein